VLGFKLYEYFKLKPRQKFVPAEPKSKISPEHGE
jgi:hypothetical protein